jgi:hypothetical protein
MPGEKRKVKNRTLYEPNAKGAAPMFGQLSEGGPPAKKQSR